MEDEPNVEQAVPFFRVAHIDVSVRFYIDGLGFSMVNQWVMDGKLRWCWLQLGKAALMLQEFAKEGHDSWTSPGKVGEGVSISFQCRDALAIYRALQSRGIHTEKPFVGNGYWVVFLSDPDGYRLEFESPTDAPEESEYEEPR